MQSGTPTCGVLFALTVYAIGRGFCDITCGSDGQSGEQSNVTWTSLSHHMRANWWQLHRLLERLCRVTR
jgi:hypothetical protein